MISNILKFELNSRFKQPMTLLFFLMLVFQGIWYTQGSYEYYVNDATLMNGAALFYKNFAGGGMLLIIVIAIITGTVLYKDIQYKSAGIFYTLPINEKKFFLGRFLSAFLVNLIIGAGIFAGMVLVPYSGIGAPDKFGPTPWGQMIHGFFVLTAGNLLMLTLVCFASLVFFKRMAAGYLSIFALVMIFLVAETTSGTASNTALYEIIDPFAYVYTAQTLDALPADAKNNSYLSLGPVFYINRLVWIGGSLLVFLLAYRKFSFKGFIATTLGKKKSHLVQAEQQRAYASETVNIPGVHLLFSTGEFIKKFWRLATLEFKNVVRPVNFKIILSILGLMFFLQNIMWNATYYLGPQQPLTSSMTLVRLTMGFFIMMLLMIWSGELFFKDRTSNIWQIMDALPVPVWVTQLSKFVAMCGVALLLALLIIVCGILAQILSGGWQEINLFQYANDLLGYKWGWLTYILNIALVFFIAGLTGNRYLTHILSIGYYFFNIISFDMGIIEELRFGYALTPGIEDFSEMNGYGIWSIASFWYFIMWTALAAVFILLGIHFWKRGATLNLIKKLVSRTGQLNFSGKGLAVICLIAFFLLQSFIVREVNDKGNFEPESVTILEDATYEKNYKWIEKKPQPKLTGADIVLDFFPVERKAVFEARMQLTNFNSIQVDSIYLSFPDFMDFREIKWNDQLIEVAWKDDKLHQLALPIAMDTAETGMLFIKANKQYLGFTQGDAQPDLAFNGLFMDARDIIPRIGYNTSRELDKNRERDENGLSKLSARMASLEDGVALSEDAFAPDATWLGGKFTIGTSPGQYAIAPGKLNRSWQENGRNLYEYQLEAPSPFQWYFASAEFESSSFIANSLPVEVHFKKEHHYNISLYEKSVKTTIDFITERLGAYPFSELRLIEIPFYQEERYAFPNVVAISEKEGWYADTTGVAERAYITFSVATQLIRHWLYQNLHVANVQGADMLKSALPEALALQVVRSGHGEEAVDILLEKKKNVYEKERGNEPNQEPPLIYADGVDYLEENKGTIALYKLSEVMGPVSFTSRLSQWVKQKNDHNAVFKDLYEEWSRHLTADQEEKVNVDFEEVAR